MSNPIKDSQIKVNVPSELIDRVKQIALATHQTPSGLARVLMEEYVSAFEFHHGRLPWPPAFQYFDTSPVATALEEASQDAPLYVRKSVPGRRVSIAAEGGPATAPATKTTGRGGLGR